MSNSEPLKEIRLLPRHTEVPGELSGLSPTERVLLVNANRSIQIEQNARDAIRTFENVIERQSKGLYAIAEAAEIIADHRQESDAQTYRKQIMDAITNGKLIARHHETTFPIYSPTSVLDFVSLLHVADLDAWMKDATLGYTFSELVEAKMKPNRVKQSTKNQTQRRTAELHAEVQSAISRAANPDDLNSVWNILRGDALDEKFPFNGIVKDDYIEYTTTTNKVKKFTKSALRARLYRMQSRRR